MCFYSAMAKLYGLKLFQKVISENQIPSIYKEQAIEYANELRNNK